MPTPANSLFSKASKAVAFKRMLAPTLLALSVMAMPAQANSVKATMTEPSAEFVYKYLLAEVAAQRGEMTLASQLFLDLAKQTRDVRLAERATQASVYAQQAVLALQSSTLWNELAPESLQAAHTASQLLVAKGDLNQALPLMRKILAQEKTRPQAFMELNNLLYKVQDKAAVLTTVKALAQDYPKLPEAHFAVAQAAFFAQDTATVGNELKVANQLRPGWEPAAQMQAQMLKQNSPDEAVKFLRGFVKQYPDSDEVRLTLAKTLLEQKKGDEAKPEFIKLAEKHQQNPEMNAVVGLLALDAKEYALADRYLQHAIDVGFREPEKIFLHLGRSASEQKDDIRALKWYDQIKQGENYLAGRIAAASIISRTQTVDAAINMLDEINDLTPEQQIIVLQSEALLLNQAKRFEEAYALLDKALNTFPDSTELNYDYALSAERIGKFDVMEKHLYKLVKMKPNDAAAYNALGYSFADRNIKLVEAKNLIMTALKLSPQDHYIMDSLGWVYFRLGDLPNATQHLRQAYTIQEDPEIAAHLAEVLWKSGQKDEAQKILDKATKAHPDNDILSATVSRLK
jgi:tetratricopeptide (TPR) repeat protein